MTNPNRSRRQFLQDAGLVTGALIAPGFLAACGSDDESTPRAAASGDPLQNIQSDRVIYSDYGGATREGRKVAYFDSFTAETGVRVVPVDADPARFVLQAKRGRGQWDCIDADGYEAITFKRDGLLEKLPPGVTRSDAVDKEARDYLTGGFAYSFVQSFSTDLIKGPGPQDWVDFWNVEKFPGKRSWPRFFYATVEPALLADGVAPADLYPLDFERAYAKLDELRPHMLFAESYTDSVQHIASGSASMMLTPHSRALVDGIDKGLPLEVVWNEAIQFPYACPAIPKGAPNLDAMFGLAEWMTDPERQAEFARVSTNGPIIKKAFDFLEESEIERLPNSPEHLEVAVSIDTPVLADQSVEYSESYTEWLAKG